VAFSKFPIVYSKEMNRALIVTVKYESTVYQIANVHLPWDSPLKKEQYIVDIIKEVHNHDFDYAL